MKKDDRNNIRRERFVMISTSALVLTALTVTGVYMRSHTQKAQDNGYSIDFSALENRADDKIKEITDRSGKNRDDLIAKEDLTVPELEVGTGEIIIPGLTDGIGKGKTGRGNVDSGKAGAGEGSATAAEKNNAAIVGNDGAEKDREKSDYAGTDRSKSNKSVDQSSSRGMSEGAEKEIEELSVNSNTESKSDMEVLPYVQTMGENPIVEAELHFSANEMQRPCSGEVLINYSMDHSVYFATLDQYKYNPAVIYSASQGESVKACATGRVINIRNDAELGHVLVLDLGDGYQAIYGQVENISIPIGATVEAGTALATVAAPTKYFSKEGTNLYFQMKKDGESINPGDYF